MKSYETQNNKWITITNIIQFSRLLACLYNFRWTRKGVKIKKKNGTTPGQGNINSERYKYAPEEFKLTLLHFLNNIYRENRIPNERRNSVIIPIFKKSDRREHKNYREISTPNTCYKIYMYSKILYMKLQNYSEEFVMETQSGFRKGRSCTDPTFCLKLLTFGHRSFTFKF